MSKRTIEGLFRVLAAEYPTLRGEGHQDTLESWAARLHGVPIDRLFDAANAWIDAGNEFSPTSGILKAAATGQETPAMLKAIEQRARGASVWLSTGTCLGSGFRSYSELAWHTRDDRAVIEAALLSIGGFYRGWMQADTTTRHRRFTDAYVAKARPKAADHGRIDLSHVGRIAGMDA